MLSSQGQIILFKPAPLSTPLHDIFLVLTKPGKNSLLCQSNTCLYTLCTSGSYSLILDLRAFPSFDPGRIRSIIFLQFFLFIFVLYSRCMCYLTPASFSLVALNCQDKVITWFLLPHLLSACHAFVISLFSSLLPIQSCSVILHFLAIDFEFWLFMLLYLMMVWRSVQLFILSKCLSRLLLFSL